MTTRKQQQAELIFKFGSLISPLLDIINNPSHYSSEARLRVRARYLSDVDEFESKIRAFKDSENGHSYKIEWAKIRHEIQRFSVITLNEDFDNISLFAQKLELYKQSVMNDILSIPTSIESSVFPALSPFSAYCFLQDLCQTIRTRFIVVDRYLADTIFYRYLRSLSDNTEVTLITQPSNKYRANEWSQFIDVSRIYAKERPNTYHLMIDGSFHDRWLCCDDQIYILGGSIKDAGVKSDFTISKLDMSTMQVNPIDQLLNTAQEIYGAANPQHP